MMLYVLLAIIFCVVVLAGASVTVFRIPPSLGRRKLPPAPSHHDAALAEIDQLERELKVGKYAKSQAEFDAEVDRALHPPKPPEPEPAAPYSPGVEMPMFKSYDEYKAWMQARYPNWHG